MRVAFDSTLAERVGAGTGVYARELLRALRGRSLDVLTWRRVLGVPGAGLSRLVNAARLTAWLTVEIPRRVAATPVDVYHAPCSIGPIRGDCPRVMTVHDATDLTLSGLYDRWWRLYLRTFGVTAVRRADAVIVPSWAARGEVAHAYRVPMARIHVTPEGVTSRFRPVPQEERAEVLARHGIRLPYILFVGVQHPRKNLDRLIEAYGRLRRRVRSTRYCLVLVGPSGVATPRVRALVQGLGMEDDVLVRGWVADEDLPALYSGATCVAYPSLAEGFGLPLLEAMACGTPVLTSDRSAMREVAGDAAELVSPLSADSIAEGFERVLTDEARRRDLVARGLARARLFTWERTAAATETVYRTVTGGRAGGTAA
jgi:glycosyltransferase involved in cell wall biosynthesis